MNKPIFSVGIMTGTSMDGADIVLISFQGPREWKIIDSQSYSLPKTLKEKTLESLGKAKTWDDFLKLDRSWGLFYTQILKKFIATIKKKPHVIGIHGQTVWHSPKRYSLQLGNMYYPLAKIRKPIVTQFRSLDTAMGFEGAPLAPLFHSHLVPAKGSHSIHNIGGISNVTFVQKGQVALAFDTGPGNIPLDLFCQKLAKSKTPFDLNGQRASRGRLIPELLKLLKKDDFVKQRPPKSTGRERYSLQWLKQILNPYRSASDEDILHTLTHWVAWTIAESHKMKKFESVKTIYFCGGGSKNKFLMENIQEMLPNKTVSTTWDLGINPMIVEAACFAWLAACRLQNIRFNLKNITGNPQSILVGQILYF